MSEVIICFASNNPHKLEEIRDILGSRFNIASLEDVGCFEELPETQPTLEGNSLQKAEFVLSNFKVPCFADDTGLEVEALGGEPGVYSARYAGEHKSSEDNIDLLLRNLHNHSNRKARFRTVVTLVGFDKQPVSFEGIVDGQIINEKRGNSGFGYDPVFVPNGYGETFAEMSLQEKSTVSHRSMAIRKLEAYLKTHITAP